MRGRGGGKARRARAFGYGRRRPGPFACYCQDLLGGAERHDGGRAAEQAAPRPIPDDDLPTALEVFLQEQDAAARAPATPATHGSCGFDGGGEEASIQEGPPAGLGHRCGWDLAGQGTACAIPGQGYLLFGRSSGHLGIPKPTVLRVLPSN